ncbi:MAG: hypothetical protein LBF08_05560 [Dysgonamonadaceae bacterium]|jgi:hypothetical protein|nr:hypothetical protein [Dysgonamonadaceae bacterium]
MKTRLLLLIVIAVGFQALAAINHGSIMGRGLPLHGTVPTAATLDFKIVTIGTSVWAWTNLSGMSLAGNDWSSQIRLWNPERMDYNLSGRIANTLQSYGKASIANTELCGPTDGNVTISFFQETDYAFYETDNITFYYAQPNSGITGDWTPPVLNAPQRIDGTKQQLRLLFSAADDSENFFYYIEDENNNFFEVSFSDETVLNLEPDRNYQFMIYAIDFSGNQSTPVSYRYPYSQNPSPDPNAKYLPDNIKNGSDFHIIYMNEANVAELGAKVTQPNLIRDIEVWNENMIGNWSGYGVNAWGMPVSNAWVNLIVNNSDWNGGAIITNPDMFETKPSLKAVTDNIENDFYFHFAIKNTQPNVGWTLMFFSDENQGENSVKYYVGPQHPSVSNLPWLGDFRHDGEWQYFEIPVSHLTARGYKWNGTMQDGNRFPLIGFQSPQNIAGAELNLDAMFFYRQPVTSSETVTVGKAGALDFRLDSRNQSLKIECASTIAIESAYVELTLNGIPVERQWSVDGTVSVGRANHYILTIPATEISGWTNDAILGLNLAYKPVGRDYVHNNNIITSGINSGKLIQHKIGTGIDIEEMPQVMSLLPDSIKNNSDFYIIYMDESSKNELSELGKVKQETVLRAYDVWNNMNIASEGGQNSWGMPVSNVVGCASIHNNEWSGGAIVTDLNEFVAAPNFKPITDNPNDYYFHFAVKGAPLSAGWTLIFYSDNSQGENGVKYHVGPIEGNESARGAGWLGELSNGWQHFEIPVSQLTARGYKWNGAMSNEREMLIGFQSEENAQAQRKIYFDAMFFYKKRNVFVPTPSEVTPITSGTAREINFRLDSRENNLMIECNTLANLTDAYVTLSIDGLQLVGKWVPDNNIPLSTGTKRYVIIIPADKISGWKKDAIVGLNFVYQPMGGAYVSDNKVITGEENYGKPILHKIGTGEDINTSFLPLEIATGSDFHIIYMDAKSEAGLGSRVKQPTMLRSYDIWPGDPMLTLAPSTCIGVNAWNEPAETAPWVSFDVTQEANAAGWNGGAIVAVLSEFETPPNLKDVTDNPEDYTFHFAVKSDQIDAGWTLIFYSDETKGENGLKYYIGPNPTADDMPTGQLYYFGSNFSHDGQWHHFEIPVSELVDRGYKWYGPLFDPRTPLIGFQSTMNRLTEKINLDAMFFYKKPADAPQPTRPSKPTEEPVTEGTAGDINFRLNSLSLENLYIVCGMNDENYNMHSAYVTLKLDGIQLTGKWLEPSFDLNGYNIIVPASDITGWKKDALLEVTFAYQKRANEDFEIGGTALHRIGMGAEGDGISADIKNGSDFYNIYVDKQSEEAIGIRKVKQSTMMRDIHMWAGANGVESGAWEEGDINAWGQPATQPWISVRTTTDELHKGVLVYINNESETPPDLRGINDDYTFHFAIKSDHPTGWILTLFSEGEQESDGDVEFYIGPPVDFLPENVIPLGDFSHDNQWRHLEIPFSTLREHGYHWENSMMWGPDGVTSLFGFEEWPSAQSGAIINLDAIFFYKKNR